MWVVNKTGRWPEATLLAGMLISLQHMHTRAHTNIHTQRLIPGFTDHHVTCRWTDQKGRPSGPPQATSLVDGCTDTQYSIDHNVKQNSIAHTHKLYTVSKVWTQTNIFLSLFTRMAHMHKNMFCTVHLKVPAKSRTKANSFRKIC